VGLKMVFEIKKSKSFKKEPSGSGIFTPQICCGGKHMPDPSRWRSQFNRRLRAAKTPASCWVVAASLNDANAPVGSDPLDGAND
jgi:hypothetical protein